MQSEAESPMPAMPVWGPGTTLGFGLAIFAVYFVAQSQVATVFAYASVFSDPTLDVEALIENLATNGLVIAISIIFSAIIGTAIMLVFIKLRKGATISGYLGLKAINTRTFLVLIGITVTLLVLSATFSLFFQSFQPSDSGFSAEVYRTSVWPALLWIAFIIFAPAFEEGFFRGFLFVGLQQSRIGAAGAIALTSLAFAALHLQYNIYGMVEVLALGVVLGFVRLKTGSLWAPLVIHSFWNIIATVFTALAVNG